MANGFAPFDYGRAVGAGTQNALGQMQAMGASRSLRDDNMMRQLSQQAAETGEDLPNLLEQAGMSQQAMVMREQQYNQKIKQYQVLKTGAERVRRAKGKGWGNFTKSMVDLGIANEGELPPDYDEELAKGLSGYAEEELKGTQEIYDPESPTGTRIVRKAEAVGKPGKMPSGMDIEFTPEGKVKSITTGRKKPKGGLEKSVRGVVQRKILSTGDTMNSITAIKNRFRPEFQEIGTRWDNMKTAWKSKLGMEIDPTERQSLDDYSQYIAEAAQNFSLVLKDMSGVAVNPTEFKRTEAWLPNPGTGLLNGDSPIELQAKIQRFENFTRRALAKYHYINNMGLTLDDVDVNQMPAIIRKRGDELSRKYRQGPGAMFGNDLKNAVRQTLADEFGMVTGQ